ncbi:MAG: hypothetical protein M1837_004217 [Sclerophora amabilis]|nr:MAG: hypothetical protein M1837_004217 [Sclerophora amabilis]
MQEQYPNGQQAKKRKETLLLDLEPNPKPEKTPKVIDKGQSEAKAAEQGPVSSFQDPANKPDRSSVIHNWADKVAEGSPPVASPVREVPVFLPSSVTASTTTSQFWRNRGYAPPRLDYMDSTHASTQNSRAEEVLTDPNAKSIKVHKSRAAQPLKPNSPDFAMALQQHNIYTRASRDPKRESIIHSIFDKPPASSATASGAPENSPHIVSGNRQDLLYPLPSSLVNPGESPDETNGGRQKDEAQWQANWSAFKSSRNAVSQMAVFVSLIDQLQIDTRVTKRYGMPWECAQMPSSNENSRLPRPSPTLAFSFNVETFLPEGCDLARKQLEKWQGHLCPAGMQDDDNTDAFHFFSAEFHKAGSAVTSQEARNQILNTAAQGLHNIYVFMRLAGEESIFFEKVRFYSAVATQSGFDIRVHFPIKLEAADRDDPDYSVAFSFEHFALPTSPNTLAQVSSIFHGIVVRYGIDQLQPMLKNTLKTVLEMKKGGPPAQTLFKTRPVQSFVEPYGRQGSTPDPEKDN